MIDAHSHIWTRNVEQFPLANGQTVDDLDPPSFNYDELIALTQPLGVSKVVLIQHGPYHGVDNSYVLHATRRYPEVFRVVAGIDDRREGTGELMRKMLPQGVTGFRITPFFPARTNWLETPGMEEMWRVGADTGQAICCLINPEDLPAVSSMCERFPGTPVVIDHLSRIGADGTIRDEDVSELCKLAKQKQVSVKVSAFYGLGAKQAPYLDLVPVIKRTFEAYGPQRLMWASDCPYQLAPGHTYADSIALVRDHLDFLSPEDREWIFSKTAKRVYFF